jgi:hypothetical protein
MQSIQSNQNHTRKDILSIDHKDGSLTKPP